MDISEHGTTFLAYLEAFRSEPYQDGTVWPSGARRWAVGYGHTIPEGQEGQFAHVSHDEAIKLFHDDLSSRVSAVNRLTGGVELNQNQFDALVAFVYNVGEAAFATSHLRQLLLCGDFAGAAEEFGKWNKWRTHPGGPLEVSSGLTLRRAHEKELFLMPTREKQELDELLSKAFAVQFDLTQGVYTHRVATCEDA